MASLAKRKTGNVATTDKAPAFTVTASMDAGEYKAGQKISGKGEVVAYFRAVMDDVSETDISGASADQIYSVLQSVKIDGLSPDDADGALVNALESASFATHIEAPKQTFAAGEEEEASKEGAELPSEILSLLGESANKKLDSDGAPVTVERALAARYIKRDAQGKITENRIASRWPVVGTRHDRAPFNVKGYNGPSPDVYKYKDKTGETISGSFYVTMWDASTVGRDYSVAITAIGKLGVRNAVQAKDLTEGERKAVERVTAQCGVPRSADALQAPNIRNAVKRTMANWRGTQINRLRTAVKIVQQYSRIESELPNVGWRYIDPALATQDVPTLARMKLPLQLVAIVDGQREPMNAMSISDFVRLDIDKAIAGANNDPKKVTAGILGGTVGERGTKNNKSTASAEGETIPGDPNVKQAYAMLGALENFFDKEALVDKLMAEYEGEDTDDDVLELRLFHERFTKFVAEFEDRAKEILASRKAKRQNKAA